MSTTNLYTENDIIFLQENYAKYGPKYCAKILNKNPDAVGAKAKRMGIKKIGYEKHNSMQKVNPEQFYNINTPEIAYFLGFFWADGNIIYRLNKTSNYYGIRLEIQSEDADYILSILNKLGVWAISKRKRKTNWKETTIITTNSKDIFNFLKEHDYLEKSYKEPTKILDKIPENLRMYWWRGYFDGDGSIYLYKRFKKLEFSSTYEYQWLECVNLIKNLNINKYHIFRQISKKGHKSSKFFIYRKNDIQTIFNYFLQSNYGLPRKTKKIHEFTEKFK